MNFLAGCLAYENTKSRLKGMRILLKAFKTEIDPTEAQKQKIIRSIGIARFLYNQYIAYNRKLYKMYTRGLLDSKQKHFMTATNGKVFNNINRSSGVKRLEKRLRREQRHLSRKYDFKKKKGGRATTASANINKQKLKVQKLHQRIAIIREDYENKAVHEIVKQKPRFITMEDLNVKGMMRNQHLAKAIAAQRFNRLSAKLKRKAEIIGIEFREVDRFYPSSKTCHACGHIHKSLKLKDRVYICPACGYREDRDYNASLNLRDAKEYRIA